METQNLVLDLSKEPRPPQEIYCAQGDVASTTVVARLYDHGAPLDAEGMAVSLAVLDSEGAAHSAAGSLSGNVATFDLPGGMAPGHSRTAYVVLEGGGKRVSTGRFRVVSLSADGRNA